MLFSLKIKDKDDYLNLHMKINCQDEIKHYLSARLDYLK